MRKFIYVVNLLLLIVFSSCSKDTKSSPLVGTWNKGNEYLTFYSDGTGYEHYNCPWCYDDNHEFTWENDDTYLFLHYNYADGEMGNRTYTVTLYYTISGKNLVLYYSDFDNKGTYTKK
ncbi:MAG: hypothetical protein E7091_02460 [Bacteroidales bacterium]|nr:hypothetical protein [Bacteroidales bacterium]